MDTIGPMYLQQQIDAGKVKLVDQNNNEIKIDPNKS